MDPTGTSGAPEGGEAVSGEEGGDGGRGEQNNFACFLASPRLHVNSCDFPVPALGRTETIVLSCKAGFLEANGEIRHRGPRHFGSRARQQNALFTFQQPLVPTFSQDLVCWVFFASSVGLMEKCFRLLSLGYHLHIQVSLCF